MTIFASPLVAFGDPCETELVDYTEGINIFRLIGVCGLLVAAWCVEVVGFAMFRSEEWDGPPKMNIVYFDKDLFKENSAKPLIGSGYDFNLPFVSPNEAQERIKEHQRNKWLGLLAGIAGAFGVFFFAKKIWDDRVIVITCVIFGPLGVAWGFRESYRNG